MMEWTEKPPRCSLVKSGQPLSPGRLEDEHVCDLGLWLDCHLDLEFRIAGFSVRQFHGRLHQVAREVVTSRLQNRPYESLSRMEIFRNMWRELHNGLGWTDDKNP